MSDSSDDCTGERHDGNPLEGHEMDSNKDITDHLCDELDHPALKQEKPSPKSCVTNPTGIPPPSQSETPLRRMAYYCIHCGRPHPSSLCLANPERKAPRKRYLFPARLLTSMAAARAHQALPPPFVDAAQNLPQAVVQDQSQRLSPAAQEPRQLCPSAPVQQYSSPYVPERPESPSQTVGQDRSRLLCETPTHGPAHRVPQAAQSSLQIPSAQQTSPSYGREYTGSFSQDPIRAPVRGFPPPLIVYHHRLVYIPQHYHPQQYRPQIYHPQLYGSQPSSHAIVQGIPYTTLNPGLAPFVHSAQDPPQTHPPIHDLPTVEPVQMHPPVHGLPTLGPVQMHPPVHGLPMVDAAQMPPKVHGLPTVNAALQSPHGRPPLTSSTPISRPRPSYHITPNPPRPTASAPAQPSFQIAQTPLPSTASPPAQSPTLPFIHYCPEPQATHQVPTRGLSFRFIDCNPGLYLQALTQAAAHSPARPRPAPSTFADGPAEGPKRRRTSNLTGRLPAAQSDRMKQKTEKPTPNPKRGATPQNELPDNGYSPSERRNDSDASQVDATDDEIVKFVHRLGDNLGKDKDSYSTMRLGSLDSQE